MIKTYKREEAGISYKQIVDLLHESFQERLAQGLRYSCSYMTEEQFIEKTKNGMIFVAIDDESGDLVGTSTLNIHSDGKQKYGYMEYVAIRSDYKHQGIGSLLLLLLRLKAAKDAGCSYVMSDTSVKAESAVHYHLKNGFKIIGLESYRSTNYWSYVFRMQLVPSALWENPIYRKLHYFFSYIFIKTTRDINGNDTTFGVFYKKMRRLCKN